VTTGSEAFRICYYSTDERPLLLDWRQPDPEDVLNLLKLTETAARPAIQSIYVHALTLLLLTLTASGVAGAGEYLRIKALVVVYTDTFAGTVTPEEVATVRREVDEAVEFIWRSSRMRIHLVVDDLTIDRFVSEDQFARSDSDLYVLPSWTVKGAGASLATDLAALGYEDGSYDLVIAFYAFDGASGYKNRYGAGSYGVNKLLDKAAYTAIPMTWRPETFNKYVEHEFLHTLGSMFIKSGFEGFPVIHNVKFFQFVNGENSSYEKWVLESVSDAEYFDRPQRWGTLKTFKDRDGDGLPDYSPYGDELPITEETLGSSTSQVDTDDDGLSDLEEAVAGIRGGTDPNNPDTDGDGLLDGSDSDPLEASGTETQ